MEMCKDSGEATQMHQLLSSKCTNCCSAVVVPGEVELRHTSAVYHPLGNRLLTLMFCQEVLLALTLS